MFRVNRVLGEGDTTNAVYAQEDPFINQILEPSAEIPIQDVPILVQLSIGGRCDVDVEVEALARTKEDVHVLREPISEELVLLP